VNNYGDEYAVTRHMKAWSETGEHPRRVLFDPEKKLAARGAGASQSELHGRVFAGEFAPTRPFTPNAAIQIGRKLLAVKPRASRPLLVCENSLKT
jgi:hypothetical protein